MRKVSVTALAFATVIAAGTAAAQYDRGRDDNRGGWFDEEAACQAQVRHEIRERNRGRIDVDFRPNVRKEDLGMGRERIRGGGIATRRDDSARFGYECLVDDRRNRVISASYEIRGRNEYLR